MPSAPTSQTESAQKAEAMRQRIADVAETLFRTMGYQKTAVADIARELGMSPANVYRFFASKSAINEAICARLLGGIAEGAWAIARSDAPAEERLRRLALHFFECNMRSFFREKRMHDMVAVAIEEHWGVIERFIEAEHGAVRHVIMDGMAAGIFPRDEPERLTRSFCAALVLWKHPSIMEQCIHGGDDEDSLRTQLLDTVALLLRGLRNL